ncbi:Zinc finger CCHC-type [Arabidopsis suecica]|uniref:Zinc finger CCHC-type n=1 Tax=Arabidopsis suecica TaxID=45249 RepID=A0A8T2B9J0_ARASU|nr:Zinc finger CCHC-type [Arabidopsis suecica]
MAAAKKPTLQDVVSDDLNYELWAPTMKTTLTEKGLWDVVENLFPADLSKIPELATETPPEDLPKWRDFMGKDTEALQILQSCLPDSVLRLTLETTSAKDLWDLLKEANEKAKFEKKLEQDKIKEGERISSLLMEFANDSSKSNYLAIAKMVISLSDSYENETDELILAGLKKLTFNRFRLLLARFELSTVNHTLYEIMKVNGYGSSSQDLESFIKWLTSMSDSYDGAALVMEELMCVKNLTYNNSRELFDLFELVPLKTISDIMNDFEVGSSLHTKEVCYSANDVRDFLKEVNLEKKEGVCSASMDLKRVLRSRHERGECIHCGGKGHVFKDCSDKRIQSRNVGPVTFDEDMWMLYTNTTNHMTPYIKYFSTLDRSRRSRIQSIVSQGMGDVRIMTKEGKTKMIKNVLYVPGMDRNVLSVHQLAELGYSIGMVDDRCTIKDQNGRLFGQSFLDKRGFFLRLQVVEGNLTS